MDNPTQILKSKGLRVTPIRSTIVEIFHNASAALSQNDIEERILDSDRITVYRTLKTFESSGIIHKVINDSHQVKYAFCKEACDDEMHHHDHIHFECDICGQTQCIHSVAVPNLKVPQGFKSHSIEILVKGICNDCNS